LLALRWRTAYLLRRTKQLEALVATRTEDLARANEGLTHANEHLTQALAEVKTLQGFIPICSSCKHIRDDQGVWEQLEAYISRHSDATFSHGICPTCAEQLYPGFGARKKEAPKDPAP
ncbi:MAG TPA: hypothetical protein VJ570_04100, partial [Holophagaceae bacterium]|nr:hypothetical protein [Holophagaceae bacterium]